MPFALTALVLVDRMGLAEPSRVEFIELCERVAKRRGHAAVELIDAADAQRRWYLAA